MMDNQQPQINFHEDNATRRRSAIGEADATLAAIQSDIKQARATRHRLESEINALRRQRYDLLIEIDQLQSATDSDMDDESLFA